MHSTGASIPSKSTNCKRKGPVSILRSPSRLYRLRACSNNSTIKIESNRCRSIDNVIFDPLVLRETPSSVKHITIVVIVDIAAGVNSELASAATGARTTPLRAPGSIRVRTLARKDIGIVGRRQRRLKPARNGKCGDQCVQLSVWLNCHCRAVDFLFVAPTRLAEDAVTHNRPRVSHTIHMSRRVYHGSGTRIGLVHMPDADIVVCPHLHRIVLWRRPPFLEVPVHRDRRTSRREFGNKHPNERFASRAPRIYFKGKGLFAPPGKKHQFFAVIASVRILESVILAL